MSADPFQAFGRDVVQISTTVSELTWGARTIFMPTIVALCRDGSVWQMTMGGKEWERLPPIPREDE